MRGKQIGIIMIALGIGVVITLVFPIWMLVLLMGLVLIGVGLLICK